jgi:hypothetical protein
MTIHSECLAVSQRVTNSYSERNEQTKSIPYYNPYHHKYHRPAYQLFYYHPFDSALATHRN